MVFAFVLPLIFSVRIEPATSCACDRTMSLAGHAGESPCEEPAHTDSRAHLVRSRMLASCDARGVSFLAGPLRSHQQLADDDPAPPTVNMRPGRHCSVWTGAWSRWPLLRLCVASVFQAPRKSACDRPMTPLVDPVCTRTGVCMCSASPRTRRADVASSTR